MKFCTSCGHKVGPSDRFCSYCGTNLTQVGDKEGSKKSDLKVENIISDTKKAATRTKKRVKKLLFPAISLFIIDGMALVAYQMIKENEQEQQAIRDQAVQSKEDKQRVIELEKCVLEHFANAHVTVTKFGVILK